MSDTTRPTLTWGQVAIVIATSVPMVAVGIAGGVGTYTNISGKYGSGTAVGVLAAGEGATAVAALVLLVTTMLGQSSPAVVRAALWLLPAAAAVMGATAAKTTGETIVFGLTPMAITAAAEGVAFLSRRVVVYRTGVDVEVQRRNAATVQRLAYHRARAANHPSEWAQKRSERASWRLAKRVGVGDVELGASLVRVQRDRLTEGADAALLDMLTVADNPPAEAPVALVEAAVEEPVADTPQPVEEITVERVEVPADTLAEVTVTEPAAIEPPSAPEPVEPLVICGDRRVWELAVPDPVDDDEVAAGAGDRLPTETAANVIRACWTLGTPVTDTARQATRSTSYVKKVFARLDDDRQRADKAARTKPPTIALVPSEKARPA